jgi:hypothetical protein
LAWLVVDSTVSLPVADDAMPLGRRQERQEADSLQMIIFSGVAKG